MISDHKQALEFLEAKYPDWYSPINIRNNTDITLTDSTLSRKLRQDRKDGRVKSKKVCMDNGRFYVAYALKKSYRGKK
jgi:hypothetical protein